MAVQTFWLNFFPPTAKSDFSEAVKFLNGQEQGLSYTRLTEMARRNVGLHHSQSVWFFGVAPGLCVESNISLDREECCVWLSVCGHHSHVSET